MDELLKYRDEIDVIDNELYSLFEKRMDICKLIGEYKKDKGLSLFDKRREDEILKRRRDFAKEEIKDETEEFFRGIMEISRNYQGKLED